MSDGQIAQALLSSKQRLSIPMVQSRERKRRLNITHRVPRQPERIQGGRRQCISKFAKYICSLKRAGRDQLLIAEAKETEEGQGFRRFGKIGGKTEKRNG